ncbi:hypothetical protein Q3G72_005694 [Acer saccharum]|nr:hypothetical protein Q3G72_005694 [Acer saccharum]
MSACWISTTTPTYRQRSCGWAGMDIRDGGQCVQQKMGSIGVGGQRIWVQSGWVGRGSGHKRRKLPNMLSLLVSVHMGVIGKLDLEIHFCFRTAGMSEMIEKD